MKPITNKTIYNPYAKEKVFHQSHQITEDEQENMKEYLETTHKKETKTLSLKCHECGLSFHLQPATKTDTFFIDRYGQIDKITGRVYELPCPLCMGVMEKITEN